MYELRTFTCWRGESTPVPGAMAERVKASPPRSFVKRSKGSAGSKGSAASSSPSRRLPKVWSRNWPHTKPQWLIPRSEKTFWPRSLKTRLLRARGDGPSTMLTDPVRVVGRRQPHVGLAGLAERGIVFVVARPVERSALQDLPERLAGPGRAPARQRRVEHPRRDERGDGDDGRDELRARASSRVHACTPDESWAWRARAPAPAGVGRRARRRAPGLPCAPSGPDGGGVCAPPAPGRLVCGNPRSPGYGPGLRESPPLRVKPQRSLT